MSNYFLSNSVICYFVNERSHFEKICVRKFPTKLVSQRAHKLHALRSSNSFKFLLKKPDKMSTLVFTSIQTVLK